MITLKLLNLQGLQRQHQYLLAENEKMMQEGAEVAGVHAKDHVNKYPAFKRRTGNLQRSTTTRVVRLPNGRRMILDNTAAYADPIDTGARPHLIIARNAPNLVFWWTKMGFLFVGKRVHHPGNKPYKFMYRAWNSAVRVEEDFLRRRMQLLAKRF